MNAGDRVRLVNDPGREGVLTGNKQKTGPIIRWQVEFPDGRHFYPEQQLQPAVASVSDDPIELIGARRFKGVDQLRGALTYGRLSGKLANLIYSMGTTNTDFYPYQFKPVLNFLESPNRGLLIADEVGLGKTIEAGLIWTELRAREQANKLLVVCPAMLREKWARELAKRFGVESIDCSSGELLDVLRSVEDGSRQQFAVIVSMQGIRPPRNWEDEVANPSAAQELAKYLDQRAHDTPLFDLVIVDEAHYMRNPESQTSKLGRLLKPVSGAMVLLSATPLQMRSNDLYELLRLLDDVSFANPTTFHNILEANQPLVDLRSKILHGKIGPEEFSEVVKKIRSHPILQGSKQLEWMLQFPPSKQDLIDPAGRARWADHVDGVNLFSRVISRTRKRDVHEFHVIREPHAIRAPMTPMEQELYSHVTAQVRNYCANRGVAEGFMLTIPQRQMTSSMPAALRGWIKRVGISEEEAWEAGFDSEMVNAPAGPLIEELASIAHQLDITWQDLKKQDSKFQAICEAVKSYWKAKPKGKIVLFSFYRETLAYLQECFTEAGISTIKLVGGVGREERERILAEFSEPGGPHILLSSEVASEGVDLQFASAMVNYDLPWNPARLEQRIGRIDRIGQLEPTILIWNLFYKDSIDDRVYVRLLERIDVFRRSLGDIESTLGPEITKLTYDLLSHQLTPDQEEQRIAQTEQALANIAKQNEDLEASAGFLMAHGDYILNQVKAAKELGRYISGEDVYRYCRDYLDQAYPGSRFVEVDGSQGIFNVRLSDDARISFASFLSRNTQLPRSLLARPISDEVLCCFRNTVSKKPRLEIISQYHPLVRFVTQDINDGGVSYEKLVAGQIKSELVPEVSSGHHLFMVVRWSMAGAKTQENLIMRAARLDNGDLLDQRAAEKLVATTAMSGRNIVGAAGSLDPSSLQDALGNLIYKVDQEFEEWSSYMRRQNEDVVAQQRNSFNAHVNAQVSRIEDRIGYLAIMEKVRTIPALQGQINKLGRIREERNADLDRRMKVAFDRNELVFGLIDVI